VTSRLAAAIIPSTDGKEAAVAWFKSGEQDWVSERLNAVRASRAKQGHQLTGLQEALVVTLARHDPLHDQAAAHALSTIDRQIEANGFWAEAEEWRISTWFESKITKDLSADRVWFTTSVACDGQTFSCRAASLERACAFMRLYQQLIIDGFYSVGPPWAG
jgi:hypothetical protein